MLQEEKAGAHYAEAGQVMECWQETQEGSTRMDQSRRITADEALELPYDGWRYELIEGKLVRMTPASWEHDTIAWRVSMALGHYVLEHHLGECSLSAAGYRIWHGDDERLLVPDFAFTRTERLPAPGDERLRGFLAAPDVVLEVLPLTDRPETVRERIADWLDNGVRVLWVILPEERHVQVWHPGDTAPTVRSIDDWIDGEDVVPGWRCPVGSLFG